MLALSMKCLQNIHLHSVVFLQYPVLVTKEVKTLLGLCLVTHSTWTEADTDSK